MFEKEGAKYASDLELIYKKGILDGYNKAKAELKKENTELKAKTQWHDLRKNPDDLPEESGYYLCISRSKIGGAGFYTVCHFFPEYKEWENLADVITWCELP